MTRPKGIGIHDSRKNRKGSLAYKNGCKLHSNCFECPTIDCELSISKGSKVLRKDKEE